MRRTSRTVRMMKSRATRPRMFASTLVVMLSLVASSCSREPQTLHGIVRDEPLNVASISLPDVTRESAPSSRVGMRAAPGDLLCVTSLWLALAGTAGSGGGGLHGELEKKRPPPRP